MGGRGAHPRRPRGGRRRAAGRAAVGLPRRRVVPRRRARHDVAPPHRRQRLPRPGAPAAVRATVPLPEQEAADPRDGGLGWPAGRRWMSSRRRSASCRSTSGRRSCWSTCRAGRSPRPRRCSACPTGTVKSRCSRGRARLAVVLGHLRNPDEPAPVPPERAAPAATPAEPHAAARRPERRTVTGRRRSPRPRRPRRRAGRRADGAARRSGARARAGWPSCAASRGARRRHSGQLRALPAPAMPAAVAARLDAALRRPAAPEPAVPAGGGASGAAAPGATSWRAAARRGAGRSAGPGRSAGRRGGGRCSPPAAPSPRSSAAAAPASTSGRRGRRRGRRAGPGRRTRPGRAQDDGGGSHPPTPADQAALRRVRPGRPAARRCRRSRRRAATRSAGRRRPGRLAACLAASRRARPASLRGVRRIRYQGQPAYVLVYADGGRLTGCVVTGLRQRAGAGPATVLDTVSCGPDVPAASGRGADGEHLVRRIG